MLPNKNYLGKIKFCKSSHKLISIEFSKKVEIISESPAVKYLEKLI